MLLRVSTVRVVLSLLTTATLPLLTHASIYITNPIATTTLQGNKSFTITWLSDTGDGAGVTPLASSFGPTTIGLYTGSSTQQTLLLNLGTVSDPSKTKSLKATVPVTVGPSSAFYFLRFQSISATSSSGVPLQAFSARFTLSKMTGQFTPSESSANAAISSSETTGGAIVSGSTAVVSTAASVSVSVSDDVTTTTTGGIQTAGLVKTTGSGSATSTGLGALATGAAVSRSASASASLAALAGFVGVFLV
ncbi:hypothetical protein T439DRAFT_383868 [Meredithblackwellia eburnea MCA 4105]